MDTTDTLTLPQELRQVLEDLAYPNHIPGEPIREVECDEPFGTFRFERVEDAVQFRCTLEAEAALAEALGIVGTAGTLKFRPLAQTDHEVVSEAPRSELILALV